MDGWMDIYKPVVWLGDAVAIVDFFTLDVRTKSEVGDCYSYWPCYCYWPVMAII